MTSEPFYGPRCGNCGAYLNPGEINCSACGAHRYADARPVMGVAQTNRQIIQSYFWWGLAGLGTIVCGILGIVFGLFDFLLRLLPH